MIKTKALHSMIETVAILWMIKTPNDQDFAKRNNSNNKTFNNPVLIARTNARDLSPKASRKWQTQSLINAADFGQWTLKEMANPHYIYATDFGQWTLKKQQTQNYI